MANQIHFQLTQLQLRSQASPELNYSFSVYSGVPNSSRLSRNNSQNRQPRFSRKKSKESTDKFRNRIKSVEKVDSSLYSTNKQQCKQSGFWKEGPSCQQKKREVIKKNFNNIYNLEHRNKQIQISNRLKQQCEQQLKQGGQQKGETRQNENRKKKSVEREKESRRESESREKIKYLPMRDVLNYNEKPIKNKKLIERRLFNKITINASYY